jgi:hypothetical protein
MPDGVTPYDFSIQQAAFFSALGGARIDMGSRFPDPDGPPMVIGTDGDGINDADEGNRWGPIGGMVGQASLSTHAPVMLHCFRSGNKTWLVAGNTWGMGVDGKRWTNSAFFMSALYMDNSADGNTRLIVGSDFASTRSAATIAAQANHFYNNYPLSAFGSPPRADILPFLEYENPKPYSTVTSSTNAWISLRGNVMVGNGIAPINYVDGASVLLNALTNFYTSHLDTSVAVIPTLYSGSNYPYLAGTFAPGIAPYTNITIGVYELDQEGWTNGQAFALPELTDYATYTNGFPQGKKYIGSFPVANTGSFNITLAPLTDVGSGQLTVTANYSQDPPSTPLARTMTSDLANPVYMVPPPYITVAKVGSNLSLSWNPENGLFTVQTNASLSSPGSWGNFTAGNVAPPVLVPIGTDSLFIRLKR